MAQSVERRIGSAEVTGPIPVSSLGKVLDFKDFFCITEKVGADMSRIYSIERTSETK